MSGPHHRGFKLEYASPGAVDRSVRGRACVIGAVLGGVAVAGGTLAVLAGLDGPAAWLAVIAGTATLGVAASVYFDPR